MGCELHHGGWPVSGILTVLAALVALAYVRGCVRLLRDHRQRARAPAAFLGGLFVTWAVIASPLSDLDHRLLTFHMLQHLLLMTVAAPLLLIGKPSAALHRGVPFPVRRAASAFARSAAVRRIGRALTHPAVCWFAGTGIVIAWHVPAAHELSMRSQAMHLGQHATFLAAGILFWWPVIERKSSASIPLYLFLATLPCDALSAFLTFCGHVLYPSHAISGLSALRDQERAGALMWFWVTFAYLLPAGLVTLRMLTPPRPRAGMAPATSGSSGR